ncbi:MAG: pimeloyl-ACP methyl ester carboxylesterase [Myxococcota bacterium]|jgi:pimeloyl-ACP methyl ester carboxylesterase
MSKRVRSGFATADDDTELYWRAVGEGPLLVCSNGVGVSTFFWRYLTEHFRDRYTVVVWDYRAHGRSRRTIDPLRDDLSIGRHAEDLRAVLDAVAPDGAPAILVGHSMGCQVILEHHRRYPHRTTALIPMLGTAGRALDTFGDWSGSIYVFRAIRRLLFSAGPITTQIMRPVLHSPLAWPFARAFKLVDPLYTNREDLQRYVEHMASIDPRVFIESVMQLNAHDVWDMLPQISHPTLIIAAENDTFTPMWCSRRMASDIPGAELLVLADASHAALIEQPETINYRLDRFLRERVAVSGPTLASAQSPA